MKKILLSIVLIALVLAVGGYLFYHFVMPKLIAEAVVSDSVPNYIPKRFQSKVGAIRAPLNKGTEAMLQTMHESDISLDQILEAVDDISEEQAYGFLDDLTKAKPTNTNEVFDMAKKHFPTDFNPEVFREPFNRNVTMKQINNGIAYANLNRRTNDVDITTAKAIVKKIIIEKEKELLSKQ